MDAYAITQALGGKWNAERQSGDVRCPAHHDRHPSATVSTGRNGRPVVHCHKGCTQNAVLDALRGQGLWPAGMEWEMPVQGARNGASSKGTGGLGQEVARYDYQDEEGRVLFQAVRYEPKDFRQRRLDAESPTGWSWGLKGTRRVLYHLPDLLASGPEQPVYIAEGEKDVDHLRDLGLVATTNPMGAGKWQPEYNAWLRDRHVVILPDNDPVGRDHADHVARELTPIAASVRVVPLPDLPEHGDVSEWLEHGGTPATLHMLVKAVSPCAAVTPWLRPISALLSQEELPIDWLVEELFSAGSSGWVGAEAKVGKSWLVLELVYCLTTASTYLERFAVTKPRKVIYIQEEDSEQRVLRRFNQLLRGTPDRQWPRDDLLRFAIRSGFKIDDPGWAARLHQALLTDPVDLCVLDVFQRLHLKSENDQAQMAAVLEVLNALNREFGCGFLVVHHNRKLQAGNEARPNQMLRGSGVLSGWAECSLYCRKARSKNHMHVLPESKDAPEIDEFLVIREDTDNGGVRLVLAENAQQERISEQAAEVLSTVQRMTDTGVDCTAQRVATALGWSRPTAYRVLEHLTERGTLETDEALFGRSVTKLYVLPKDD